MVLSAKAPASFDVTPTSAALGAEVRGLDLARGVTPQEAEALRALLAEHLLLVLPGQPLAPEQYVAVARSLGEIAVEPFVAPMAGHPEIIVVLKEADEDRVAVFGESWHSDFTFLESPPMATMLHALETPTRGGDTLYVNSQRAY